MIIASLKTKHSSAVLTSEGNWQSGNTGLRALLNARFNRDLFPPSPAEAVQGQLQLEAAAKEMDGQVQFVIPPTSTPGRVY